MPRLAPLFAAALCLVLSPLHAWALTAVFDFDDFPYIAYTQENYNDLDPYTYAYGCDAKEYCSPRDIIRANYVSESSTLGNVSTTRNGIFMELGGREMLINFEQNGGIIHGDDSDDYDLFLLDFDTPLRSFSARFDRPEVITEECDDVCTDIYELLRLYLWSEPGGQGDLVGSLTITPYDALPPGLLTVALVTGAPFRSANIGKAISTDPDCIAGNCGVDGYGYGGPLFYFDDILVSTVPEPTTAALVALGLTGAAAARRLRAAV